MGNWELGIGNWSVKNKNFAFGCQSMYDDQFFLRFQGLLTKINMT
jgi:hypothetical protein